MKIADLTCAELAQRLKTPGILWRIGPFLVHLRTLAPDFAIQFHLLYGEYPLEPEPCPDIIDFHIELVRDTGLRRWWRPKVFFTMDGPSPFSPFPLDHALPLFEWGFNYCIAARANQYLLLHTAVVAKGDQALLLPGLPGSGKSTLCAALILKGGWRLLSDEFALLRPTTGEIFPLPRTIALKNDSIAAIRAFDANVILGPEFPKTRKGTVAHMQPPLESVQAANTTAWPTWVVCPQFRQGATAQLELIPKDHGFLRLSANAFNYELQGARGFQAIGRITRTCTIYDLRFGELGEAVNLLTDLIKT